YTDMNAIDPRFGISHSLDARSGSFLGEGIVFASSFGTVYSTNSLLATDSGSAVTAMWQSAPISSDLPGSYKQALNIQLDYTATSRSTVTTRFSADGGQTFADLGVLQLATSPRE